MRADGKLRSGLHHANSILNNMDAQTVNLTNFVEWTEHAEALFNGAERAMLEGIEKIQGVRVHACHFIQN